MHFQAELSKFSDCECFFIAKEIAAILQGYDITNVGPVLFTLSSYHSLRQIERDLNICNKAILRKPFETWPDQFLNYPIPDSEVVIESDEDVVRIDVDLMFDDGYVKVPIWLFKALLELAEASLKLNGGLFHSNKTIVEKGSYDLGQREGAWIQYFESGEVQKKSYYDAGQPSGIWLEYYINGQLKSIQDFNFQDYRNRLLQEWEADGKPKKSWRSMISTDEVQKRILNGQLKSSYQLVPEKEVIELTEYDNTGSARYIRHLNLKGNLADGIYRYYDDAGKLTQAIRMENGERKEI